MNGLSATAWRAPWHVRAIRAWRRDPGAMVQRAGAWLVYALSVLVSMVLIPLALLVMGGPA